ncbi:MAG: hypothetical protein H3C54_12520 [Taibaiella sp.]|nr:hypothetical protein [Taibaiella sp.]
MKYTTAILALMIILAVSACKKTRTCPAFDDTTLNTWFPYQTGVTYKFISSDGRQEMFTIEQEYYTQEHEIEKDRFLGKKYSCEINGERKTLTDSVLEEQIPLRLFHVVEHDIDNNNNHYFAGINMTFRTMVRPIILGTGGDKLTLAGSYNSGYSSEHFDVWNVNNRNYRNITDITIADKEADKIGMDKIYIAQGAGIIGYRTYPEGREYWQE